MPEIDAIAIVGVGLRLPGGVHSLNDLWTVLSEGRDVIGEVPPDRFDPALFRDDDRSRPGKTYTTAGGFLDDVDAFDAEYFRMSPKEAAQVDPQQRLLLECAVEAFDDAQIDPAPLAGSAAAVVVGVSSHDYYDLQEREARSLGPHFMAGNSACNTANRMSYFFDLQGPSMAVDTACASTLTAVHQACEAIRAGYADLALAGGVNVIVSPTAYVGFARASMLSPTGRCHPFSADADGFVRAEGAGVFVLKRLDAALADGDRMHGVIAGSGVNVDGRTAGLSLPSATAQAQLLERVYTRAGIDPGRVAYVEAHGTGTAAGDPIECASLSRVLGAGRNAPLPIGSVKGNLGHAEAAAGVAGLAKALLVVRHGMAPATPHALPLNPGIDFAGLGLAPVTQAQALELDSNSVVGVNGFGFGGANAHVIVAPPPAQPQPGTPAFDAVPLMVSGHNDVAVTEAAQRLADRLESAGQELYDVAYTSCRRRGRREHRLVALAASRADAVATLRAAATGGEAGEMALPEAAASGRAGDCKLNGGTYGTKEHQSD